MPPTPDESVGFPDGKVRREIPYRQAPALGLVLRLKFWLKIPTLPSVISWNGQTFEYLSILGPLLTGHRTDQVAM